MTKIFGHRGCSGTFPENTLLGIQEAVRLGVEGLEIDVNMTKDGEVVVIHDEILNRTTDGNGYVKDHTLSEIKQYSAGVNFSHFKNYDMGVWDKERVPTLQEVLELLSSYDVELNIELKTYMIPYEGLEEAVIRDVEKYGNGRKVVYSSFHLPTLLRLKRLSPDADIAWLLDSRISFPLEYMETLKLEALHFSRHILLTRAHLLENIMEYTRVWTVNDSDEMMQLFKMNISALITDFPAKAIYHRHEIRALT